MDWWLVEIITTIVAGCIWGIIWGVVTNKIIENKGYNENWFWWGFFFGFLALIVAATKPECHSNEDITRFNNEIKSSKEMLRNGGWLCGCGRTNPSYTGTCVCGATKDGSVGSRTITKPSSLAGAAVQTELEKMKAEEIRVLSNGGWKCHRCQTVNPAHIGFCGCGMTRGQNKEIDKKNENKQPEKLEEIKTQQNENDKFDEIKKYKELLDTGIITEEQFETKKKQLLGL